MEDRWRGYEFVVASTWGRTIKQRTLPKKWKAIQEGVEKEIVVPQSAVMMIIASRIAGRITAVEKDEFARFCAVALEGEQVRRVVIMSGHAHYHSAAKEEVMREALAETHQHLLQTRMQSNVLLAKKRSQGKRLHGARYRASTQRNGTSCKKLLTEKSQCGTSTVLLK